MRYFLPIIRAKALIGRGGFIGITTPVIAEPKHDAVEYRQCVAVLAAIGHVLPGGFYALRLDAEFNMRVDGGADPFRVDNNALL